MLLVFGRDGGDSLRILDRREKRSLQNATTHTMYSAQHPPKFRDRISFQNQDGLNTTHTTTQPQSAGCGSNMMSSRNTMLLVFNRGGPGSYRSRERRGVISQKETQFCSKVKRNRFPGA